MSNLKSFNTPSGRLAIDIDTITSLRYTSGVFKDKLVINFNDGSKTEVWAILDADGEVRTVYNEILKAGDDNKRV